MSQLKSNVLASLLGQGWASLMGLLFVPMYIHYLGIESYGIIGFFAVLLAWFAFLDMAIVPVISREMAMFLAGAHKKEYVSDLLRSFEIICMLLFLVIFVVLFVLSDFFVSSWLNLRDLLESDVREAIVIMGAVIGLRIFEGVYKGSLLGLQRQVWFNAVNAVLATIRHAGAVAILAFVSPTIVAFFYWQGFMSLLTIFVLSRKVRFVLPQLSGGGKFNHLVLGNIKSFTGGIITITLLSILLTQVDKILLSKFLSLDDFGFYMLAATVASVLYAIIIPVTQAFFPKLVEHISEGQSDELARDYHLGAQVISVLILPIAFTLFFFGEDVLFVWSGDIELAEKVAPVLAPLILGTCLNGLVYMPYQLQLASAWTSLAIRINIVAIFVFMPLIFFIAPRYGGVGVAWVWVALNTGYLIFSVMLMHRKLLPSEWKPWFVKDIFMPLMSGLVGVLVLSMLTPLMNESSRWQSFSFILFCVVFLFSLTTLGATRVRSKLFSYVRCGTES